MSVQEAPARAPLGVLVATGALVLGVASGLVWEWLALFFDPFGVADLPLPSLMIAFGPPTAGGIYLLFFRSPAVKAAGAGLVLSLAVVVALVVWLVSSGVFSSPGT